MTKNPVIEMTSSAAMTLMIIQRPRRPLLRAGVLPGAGIDGGRKGGTGGRK